MQIQFRAQEIELPDETRAALERRLRLTLGRHAAGIDRARVTLGPDPDGSGALRCRVRLRFRDGRVLAIEDQAADPQAALAAAAWRLEHRLDWQPGGSRTIRRRAPHVGAATKIEGRSS